MGRGIKSGLSSAGERFSPPGRLLYALSFSGFYLAYFCSAGADLASPSDLNIAQRGRTPCGGPVGDWGRSSLAAGVPASSSAWPSGTPCAAFLSLHRHLATPIYEGGLFGLLNSVALFCGLVAAFDARSHAWRCLACVQIRWGRRRPRKEFGVKAAIASSILFGAGGCSCG